MVTLAQITESSKQQVKEMMTSTMKTIEAITESKPKEFQPMVSTVVFDTNCTTLPEFVAESSLLCRQLKVNSYPVHLSQEQKCLQFRKITLLIQTDSEPKVLMHSLQAHGVTGSSSFLAAKHVLCCASA